jgi:hypothetical protein
MHLFNDSGVSLSLSVSGYQFPELATQPYDSNWLNVDGSVNHPRGAWSFRAPCLLTYELERLCRWLESVAASPAASHEAEAFTEPNLEFCVVQSGGQAHLRVHLGYESTPPWLSTPDVRVNGLDLDFPVARNDLYAAARGLRDQLARYPQRAAV